MFEVVVVGADPAEMARGDIHDFHRGLLKLVATESAGTDRRNARHAVSSPVKRTVPGRRRRSDRLQLHHRALSGLRRRSRPPRCARPRDTRRPPRRAGAFAATSRGNRPSLRARTRAGSPDARRGVNRCNAAKIREAACSRSSLSVPIEPRCAVTSMIFTVAY